MLARLLQLINAEPPMFKTLPKVMLPSLVQLSKALSTILITLEMFTEVIEVQLLKADA